MTRLEITTRGVNRKITSILETIKTSNIFGDVEREGEGVGGGGGGELRAREDPPAMCVSVCVLRMDGRQQEQQRHN